MISGYAGIMKSSRSLPGISHILEYIAILQLENNTFTPLIDTSAKKCSHKTQLQLKELKSLAWKDVDEKWFNELINKKEEKLLQNIERNNGMNSTISTSTSTISSNNNNQISMDIDTVDIVDDADDEDDDDDTLDKTIIYDDTLHSYF